MEEESKTFEQPALLSSEASDRAGGGKPPRSPTTTPCFERVEGMQIAPSKSPESSSRSGVVELELDEAEAAAALSSDHERSSSEVIGAASEQHQQQ